MLVVVLMDELFFHKVVSLIRYVMLKFVEDGLKKRQNWKDCAEYISYLEEYDDVDFFVRTIEFVT